MNEELKIFITAQIDDLKKDLNAAKSEVKDFSSDSEKSVGKFSKVMAGVGKGVGAAMTLITGAFTAIGGAIIGVSKATEEYRVNQAQLNAAFLQANISAEGAKEVYTELYKVIGDDDQATESAANIAMLTTNIQDAQKWAGLASGVLGTFHDTLQPEAFFEAANETLKLGEATGAFTQMLEQTGVMSVADFNAALAQCNTEEEKQALLLSVSEQAMGKAGAAFNESTKNIQGQREAQVQLNDAMAKLGELATPILTALTVLAADLLERFTPFITLIGDGFTAALNGSAEAGKLFEEGFRGILDAVINIIKDITKGIIVLYPVITDACLDVIPILITKLLEMIPLLLKAGTTMLNANMELIPVIINRLIRELPQIIHTIINVLLSSVAIILAAAIKMFTSIITAIPKIIPELVKVLPKIIIAIQTGLYAGIKDMATIGKDLVKGLWNGIKDMTSWITGKIKGFSGDVLGGIKSFFGIKSPSKVMQDVVGKNLALGIGEGFLDNIAGVNKEIKNSMQPLTNFSIAGNITAPEALGFSSNTIKTASSDSKLDNVLSALAGSQPVILQVDGKTLGKVVIDRINQTTKQTGAIPLIFA